MKLHLMDNKIYVHIFCAERKFCLKEFLSKKCKRLEIDNKNNFILSLRLL